MSKVEVRVPKRRHMVAGLLVDGQLIYQRSLMLECERPLPPWYDDPDERVRELAQNTSWGVLFKLHVDGAVIMETDKPPVRTVQEDGYTVYRWDDVQVWTEFMSISSRV